MSSNSLDIFIKKRDEYNKLKDKDENIVKLFNKVIKSINKNKIPLCKPGKEELGRGGFGVVYQITYEIARKIQKIDFSDKLNLKTLLNLCTNVKDFQSEFKKLFPNNFNVINNCSMCIDEKNNLYRSYDMTLIDDYNLSEQIEEMAGSEEVQQTRSIIAQLYYIMLYLHKKTKIMHKDVKPDNVMINEAQNDFIYKGLGNIEIKIKKGEVIPILIDYDLSTINKNEDDKDDKISDYIYFLHFYKSYLKDFDERPAKYRSSDHEELGKDIEAFRSLKINDENDICAKLKKLSPNSEIICNLKKGGKKRLRKKPKKKIRKHRGINKTTGKLKKGYKYSRKKLKSGLKQIVKVKS